MLFFILLFLQFCCLIYQNYLLGSAALDLLWCFVATAAGDTVFCCCWFKQVCSCCCGVKLWYCWNWLCFCRVSCSCCCCCVDKVTTELPAKLIPLALAIWTGPNNRFHVFSLFKISCIYLRIIIQANLIIEVMFKLLFII